MAFLDTDRTPRTFEELRRLLFPRDAEAAGDGTSPCPECGQRVYPEWAVCPNCERELGSPCGC